MLKLNKKDLHLPKPIVLCQPMQKHEAIPHIIHGTRHLHSHKAGFPDNICPLTHKALSHNKVPIYSWEVPLGKNPITVTLSTDRTEKVMRLIDNLPTQVSHVMKYKIASVFEELITNSLYHAYQTNEKTPKYKRLEKVHLPAREAILLSINPHPTGIALSIKDHGGTLTFKDIQKALKRTHLIKTSEQMEQKAQGAGLGLFMVFSLITHLKFHTIKNTETTTSCWINYDRKNDPMDFSFNYFGI